MLIYLFFSFDLLHFAWKTRSIHIFTNDPTSFFLMAEYIPICVYVCVCVVVVVHCAYSSDERLYILVSSPSSPQLALPLPCASFGCWAIHLQTHSSVPHTHWLFILQWVLQVLCVQKTCLVIINKLCNYQEGRQKGRKKGSTIVCWHWQLPSQHRYIKIRPEEQWLCQQEQGAYANSASL